MTETIKLSSLKRWPDNPRIIKDDAFRRLVESIIMDPEYLEKNTLGVADGVVYMGNQRLSAIKEAWRDDKFAEKMQERYGITNRNDIPSSWVFDCSAWSETKRIRCALKDNSPDALSGEWDYDILANQFDDMTLKILGFELHTEELIDRDLGERSGTSPWERMNGSAASGYMFQLGEITCRVNIDESTYESFKLKFNVCDQKEEIAERLINAIINS